MPQIWKAVMWQSVPEDSATFSFPRILLCNPMPGLGVTGPQAETHCLRRWWWLGLSCSACPKMCTFIHPPPHQLTGTIRWRAVTLRLGTAASDTLGGLDYSKEWRRRTNNNSNVHAQMLRAWSGAEGNGPQTAYVDSSGRPAPCASCTISVGGTTGLPSKLFEGSQKWLLPILTDKKISHGTRIFRL